MVEFGVAPMGVGDGVGSVPGVVGGPWFRHADTKAKVSRLAVRKGVDTSR